MFRDFRRNEVGDGEESEYSELTHFKPCNENKSSFKFFSKVFSSRNKKRSGRARSPFVRRNDPRSPRRIIENVFLETDREEIVYQSDLDGYDEPATADSQYNVLYIEGSSDNYNHTATEGKAYSECDREVTKPERDHDRVIGKKEPFFEVVNVVDRGTDPCDLMPEKPSVADKSTDPPCPRECDLPSCENEKSKLNEELTRKEQLFKSGLEEGNLLLEDLEKIKRHLCTSGKIPEVISSCLNIKNESPADFLHLGRKCLMELSKHLLATQKQTDSDIQKLKNELNSVKKEKLDKEEKISNLKRKLNAQTEKCNSEEEDSSQLQSKIKKLQESLDAGKKMFRDCEISSKSKIEKLETELTTEKEKNSNLRRDMEEKSFCVSRLESEIKGLQNTLEYNKLQIKDLQSTYKAKLSKVEQEYSAKMANICENQTSTNEQLSKALERSSDYCNQLQEAKRECDALADGNKALQEKIAAMERELGKSREHSVVAERRLARETQEVMALRNQVEQMEAMKEEELMSVDGDIWCQIMYQHDQWILDDLRASLKEKEHYLESLRSQGDCALRDFEKVQNELQQRRQQFNELKDVFLDFEKKRDSVVREQRDFYNKMMLLSKKTIPRDRFFKNLIEECQMRNGRIMELEAVLQEANLVVEETKKNSEAQLKAMQTEMQFTAEKLYEFENQIRIKEMQMQEVIKVFEQEKKNKAIAEETLNTFKILLEDSKKENSEIRNKLNYLEDLEKSRSSAKASEELASEIQRRKDTERKLKKLEKELVEMKNILKAGSATPHSDKSGVSSRDAEQMQSKIQELLENKKYMERILMESQRSKEQLQKDHEELYNKMRHAVRVMVESKRNQEELERRLDQRGHTIQKLQKSQVETEDRLEELKDILHEMKKTIELLYQDREELQEKLSNHMHCHAERAVHQELKSLQRDKAILEEQNSREKEMLLRRIKDNETVLRDQLRHIRSLQDQLESVSSQLREVKSALVSERHSHTQQLLTVQSEKKKQEMYVQELEERLAFETRLRMKGSSTLISSPNYVQTTDRSSYEAPIRDFKYHRK